LIMRWRGKLQSLGSIIGMNWGGKSCFDFPFFC
jgi:hypothetical protein